MPTLEPIFWQLLKYPAIVIAGSHYTYLIVENDNLHKKIQVLDKLNKKINNYLKTSWW